MTTRTSATVAMLIAAGAALTGCSGGDEPADDDAASSTTVEVTSTTGADGSSEPGSSAATTAPSTVPATTAPATTIGPTTTTTEPYDETARTPLDQLADRFAATVERQGGDPDVAQCMTATVVEAWNNGELSPVDLDEYARAGNITEAMQTFLADLQASADCAQG